MTQSIPLNWSEKLVEADGRLSRRFQYYLQHITGAVNEGSEVYQDLNMDSAQIAYILKKLKEIDNVISNGIPEFNTNPYDARILKQLQDFEVLQ